MKFALGVLLLALMLAVACGGGGTAGLSEATSQVRGQVVEVVPRNITEIETLRIRDRSGRELTFTAEGYAGFTPSHLKEHQLFGQPVLVTYVQKGDRLVAVDITD